MVESLWPKPAEMTERPPLAILREQAEALTQASGGLLVGNVSRQSDHSTFLNTLQINAPSLNNYTFNVVTLSHEITLYPCRIYVPWTEQRETANDENQLIERLRVILNHDYMKQVLSSLLAQVS